MLRIVEYFRNIIRATGDKRLVPYYAEYFVALKLVEQGYTTDILMKKRGPDIRIMNIDSCVDVKSSHIDSPDWACGASFYKGTSIKKREFDYCIFVVFKGLEAIEFLVFSLDELREVAEKQRPYPITAYPNNPCVLFRYASLEEYENAFPNKEDRLDIEIKLHRHPQNFRDRWDKMR